MKSKVTRSRLFHFDQDDEDDGSLYSDLSSAKKKYSPLGSDDNSSHRHHRSLSPSSETSKSSHEDLFIVMFSPIFGRLNVFKEIYPSIEQRDLPVQQIPLIFLGAEKFLRLRFDWKTIRYPMTSNQIELIIDLNHLRTSFVREIARVTALNLFRPLIKTIRG